MVGNPVFAHTVDTQLVDVPYHLGGLLVYNPVPGVLRVFGVPIGRFGERNASIITNMLNAIEQGIVTASTKKRLEDLETTKKEIETNILKEELSRPQLTREQMTHFIYRFRKLDVTRREDRQRLIDSFLNSIYLFDDKLIITFNYRDGAKTVSLKDIEGSDLYSASAPKNTQPVLRVGVFL